MPHTPPDPLTLARAVAAEHWTTLHDGFHCVGCGWDGNGDTEDYGAATRRHVAEQTVAALTAHTPQVKTEDEIRADERERIAQRLDSEGHHWSGEPARTYFRAADIVRGDEGTPQLESSVIVTQQ